MSAATSRADKVPLGPSERAFEQANLGAKRGRQREKRVGDGPTGHIEPGLRLSLGGRAVDPSLHTRMVDAFHHEVLHTVPGEAMERAVRPESSWMRRRRKPVCPLR